MQARQLLVAMAILALGTVARADSIVPCNHVDDFCVAPSTPRAGAADPAPESGPSAARPFIPANFVDDFGVVPPRNPEGGAVSAEEPVRRAPSRSFIGGNYVDDFGIEAESR